MCLWLHFLSWGLQVTGSHPLLLPQKLMKRAIFRETFLSFNFPILKCISKLKGHFSTWKSVGYTRRSNQSIPKEINPEYSLEGLMLKLKLQYFGHLMWRTDSLEKTLMLGEIESGRIRGQQRMRLLMASLTQWAWVGPSSRSWWWTGKPDMLQSMGSQRVGHDWATELNWTDV